MKRRAFWSGFLGGLILAALVGLLVLPLLGLFDTTATGKPNILDWWGEVNLENSLRWRADDGKIPDGANLEEGFEHYRAMCLHCHGAPDAERQEWAYNMLPVPPKLWDTEVQQMTDAQLFSIIKDGIRMTGMPAFGPTHSNKDIWRIAAFVRRLNQLSPEQKHELREASMAFGHHEEHDEPAEGEHGH